jgi:hypothetical protein
MEPQPTVLDGAFLRGFRLSMALLVGTVKHAVSRRLLEFRRSQISQQNLRIQLHLWRSADTMSMAIVRNIQPKAANRSCLRGKSHF